MLTLGSPWLRWSPPTATCPHAGSAALISVTGPKKLVANCSSTSPEPTMRPEFFYFARFAHS